MDTTTSKVLAPEDISPGDYIAPLSMSVEFLDVWRESRTGPPEVCRASFLACAFTPYKVVSVCLPFVLVEDMKGEHETLDVRRCVLARLDEDFAEAAIKKGRKRLKASGVCLEKGLASI
jgi:hypothetical protein